MAAWINGRWLVVVKTATLISGSYLKTPNKNSGHGMDHIGRAGKFLSVKAIVCSCISTYGHVWIPANSGVVVSVTDSWIVLLYSFRTRTKASCINNTGSACYIVCCPLLGRQPNHITIIMVYRGSLATQQSDWDLISQDMTILYLTILWILWG